MHGLRSKILLLTLVPLLVVLVAIGGLTIVNKSNTERQLLLDRLSSYITLIESGDLSFESSADKTKLNALFYENVEFAEIVRQDLSVLYSTENSAVPLVEERDISEVNEAFEGIETTKTIQRNGRSAFVIISPLIVNGRVVAALRVALSNERSSRRVMEYVMYVFLFTAAGIIISYVLISLLLNDVVLQHIYNLKNATLEMQKGNLTAPIVVNSGDEIGDFAKVFDRMRQEVQGARVKLEEYNKQLEGQIQERTRELEEKVDELERMNKLMVGRELKMTEMKQEIQKLREQIEKLNAKTAQSV